jgi:RsiW-degrading membrane proteinase PrsW (M82 family)
LLRCVRFIKVNKLLKTVIVLAIVSLISIVLPVVIKVDDISIQSEIDDCNIFEANFNAWTVDNINNNVFCIIAMVLVGLTIAFVASGLISHFRRKKHQII